MDNLSATKVEERVTPYPDPGSEAVVAQEKDIELSVIVPAFNEEAIIGQVLEDIKKTLAESGKRWEIVVVDDGSRDNTFDSASIEQVKTVRHPYNIGNGAAVKTGIRNSRGKIVCVIDADGQHDPNDILRLVEHIPEYDIVVGARTSESEGSFLRDFGNRVYNWLASYLSGTRIDDLTSGLRAIKRSLALQLWPLIPNAFSCPTTTSLASIKAGYAIRFVPIRTQKRVGKSKIKLFKDGTKFFLIIFKIITIYSPLKIFMPISATSLLLGTLYMIYTLITEVHITNFSLLTIGLAVIVFLIGLISEQITSLKQERMALHE